MMIIGGSMGGDEGTLGESIGGDDDRWEMGRG